MRARCPGPSLSRREGWARGTLWPRDGAVEQTGQAARPQPGRMAYFRAALGLGLGAFGSSQRMQAPLEAALVRERRWVTEEEHAALLQILELFPGAPSANTLALVGQRLGGWTWSLLGYLGFVLPGVLITAVLAWLYVQFDLGTRLESVFRGFGGASVGAILALTIRRVRGGVHARWQMAVAGAALLLTVAGKASPTEVVLLGAATGLFVELGLRRRRPKTPPCSAAAGGGREHGALGADRARSTPGGDARVGPRRPGGGGARPLLPHRPRCVRRRGGHHPPPERAARCAGLAHPPAVRRRGLGVPAHARSGAAPGDVRGLPPPRLVRRRRLHGGAARGSLGRWSSSPGAGSGASGSIRWCARRRADSSRRWWA